jgi:hypothetical protein
MEIKWVQFYFWNTGRYFNNIYLGLYAYGGFQVTNLYINSFSYIIIELNNRSKLNDPALRLNQITRLCFNK